MKINVQRILLFLSLLTCALSVSSKTSNTFLEEELCPVTITGYAYDVTCNGNSDGGIDITVDSSNPPFIYEWDPLISDVEDIYNIPPGTYCVTVTDAAACSAVACFSVNEPAIPFVQIISENIGGAYSLYAFVSGGTGNYTYYWSSGETNPEIFVQNEGDYCVEVIDDNGCSTSSCITVASTPLDLFIEGPDELCVGECTSYTAIDLNGSQIDEAVWYFNGMLWSGTTIDFCADGIAAGPTTLSLEVFDALGNIDTLSKVIEIISNYPLEIVSTSLAACPDNNDDATCDKTCANSTITYTVPGSQGLDLHWEVLGAESYEIDNNLLTVTWGNPGVGEISVSAGNTGGALDLHCTSLSPSTPNGASGTATVYVGGGTAPYSYLWCYGGTGSHAQGLASGTCTVTVTDNNGLSDVCSVTIPEMVPDCFNEPAISDAIVIHSYCGEANGSIDLIVTGGVAPFDYLWSDGQAGNSSSIGLYPGVYSVTITDGNNCSVEASFPIFSSDEMIINAYMINPANISNSGGAAGVQVLGGVPPYTYNWSNGEINPEILNLPFGSFCITVTDSNGCYSVGCTEVSVNEFCGVHVYLTIDELPSSCYNGDGSLNAVVNGSGTALWSNNTTGLNGATGLLAGNHCVTLTDVNGCTSTDCIVLPCDQSAPASCSGEGSLCIDIIPEPDARIVTDPPAVNNQVILCKGETIHFQNASSEADNYVWELGDGYSTAAEELSYVYNESGSYEVLLIARNECFCIDTVKLQILVTDSELPEIICNGTTCANNEQTYTTSADCNNFDWTLSANGTIVSGGGATDNFVTVVWGNGPIGEVSVSVANCTGDYCNKPTTEQIPIIQDGTPIDGPGKICPGDVTIYSLPLWTGTSYNWTVAEGGEIKSGEFTNSITVKWDIPANFNDDLWVNCVYENCFLDCGGESHKDLALTPEYYLAGNIEACESGSSSYSAFDAIQNNSVYCNWTVYDPNENVVTTENNAHTLDVSWPLLPGKYRLVATPANQAGYCNSDYTIYVNVRAAPLALTAIDGLNAICPGEYYTYTAVANQGNVSYYWEINNGGTLSENLGQVINVQWGMNPPYELTVKQVSNDGLACESLPYTMTVDAITEIGLMGPDELCVETTETYTANEVGNATYEWEINPSDAGTLLSGQGSNTVEVLWNAAGVANISVALCGTNENISVNVSGFPNPVVNHPAQLCPGETSGVSTTESFSTYSWRNEGGTQISTSATPNLGPGYYELVVTNSVGCEGQGTFEIDAWPEPEISITNSGFNFFCVTAGFPIPTLHALNTDDGYVFEWYRNGVALNVFTDDYTPSGEGTYYVLVTDVNGCTNPSNSIFLNETCNPDGTCTNPPGDGGCPNVTNVFNTGDECRHGLFENTSIGYVPGSTTWDFGDFSSGVNNTSTLDNPEHTFTKAGLFNILMTVTSPSGEVCFINSPFEVPVAANFDVEFACIGEPTTFKDISTFTSGTTVTNWEWNFGDPTSGVNNTSSLEEPEHTYENLGNYDVTLTVTAQTGCTSTITKAITVLPPPDGNFVAPTNSCEATALSFIADLGTDVISSSWDFGDPASGAANTATSSNTFHAFSAPGIFNVTLSFSNVYGCNNSVTLPVNVDANGLNGEITMDPSSPICAGNETTAMSPAGGTAWTWGDGQQIENITLTDAGVYDVTLTDDFGCTYSPPSAVLDVVPNPEATIKVTEFNEFGQPADCFFDGYILCEGEDVFLSVSGAGDYSYTWSTGGSGSTLTFDEGHNSNLTAGTYDFLVTVTDNVSGCTNIEGPYTVVVNPVPTDIQIATNPPGPICEGTEAQFYVSNPEADLTYLWNTGEYGTNITASTAGEYFVRAVSQFGCEGESDILEIYRAPDANLVPDGCHIHCSPDTVCLPEMSNVSQYQWYLDDNPIAAPNGTSADLMPEESGSYRVELYNIHGCYTASDAFNLELLPYSDDSLTLGTCEGQEVNFDGEVLPPGTTTTFNYANFRGCDSIVTVTVIESINYEMSESIGTCEGTMIEYNGEMYEAGDDLTLEYLTIYGCDSLVHLNVVAWPRYTQVETFNTCSGESIIYEGEEYLPGTTTDIPLTTIRGCDSIVTIIVNEDLAYSETVSLDACEGEMVMYEGVAYPAGTDEVFEYTTIVGCDSIINLTVSSNPTFAGAESFNTCEGSQVEFAGVMLNAGVDTLFTFVNQYNCDSIVQVTVAEVTNYEESVELSVCEGEQVMYNGVAYSAGETVQFDLTSIQNCDSTVYLSVAPLPVYEMTETYSTCSGSSIIYEGETLEAGSSMAFNFTTIRGCDSIVMVVVNEDLAYSETVNLDACEGEMIMYEGVAYPAGTSEVFAYTTIVGCDSIINLTVISNPIFAGAESFNTCEGSQVEFAGVMLNAGVDTLFTFANQYNCDSVVQVSVTEVTNYEESVELSVCEGEQVMYNGVAYSAGATAQFDLTSIQNCDSTVYLSVAPLPVYEMTETYSTCSGSSIIYEGETLEAGSSMAFNFTTIRGCDSIVMVVVNEDLAYSETVSLDACEGEQVMYNGVAYPAGTSEVFAYTTIVGCDSIINLNVISNPIFAGAESFNTCEGSQVEFAGVMLNAGVDTLFTFANQYNCDSIVQVSVTEVTSYEENVELSACEGEEVMYNGVAYSTGETAQFDLTSIQNCDSTVYLSVAPLPVYEMTETYSTCSGTFFMYEGESLAAGSSTTFNFATIRGCDSIVMVIIAEDLAYNETIEMTGCEGEAVIYNGNSYLTGTTETFAYTTTAGCDSTILLSIAALPLGNNEVELYACSGTTATYVNDELSPGSYDYTFENQFGCDSLVEVNVMELANSFETVLMVACEGNTVTYEGVEYAVGTDIDIAHSTHQGCDSIINLQVNTLSVSITNVNLDICASDSIAYNGTYLFAGTTTEHLFVAANGCDSIVIVELESYPEFDFSLSATDLICWNDGSGEIVVEAISGGTVPFLYAFDESAFQTDSLTTNASAGQHYVYVQDGNGCIEEQTITIASIPPLELNFIAPDLNCADDSIKVKAQLLSGQTDSMIYQWQHGLTGTDIPIYDPGQYSLAVTNECETRSFDLEVTLGDRVGDGYFYIPNSFSPNGDGTNDEFLAYAAGDIEVLIYEMRLFDRWGNTLYQTTQIKEGWDGKYQEEPMNPGVYVWWVRAEVLVCGRRVEQIFEKGDVTIFR